MIGERVEKISRSGTRLILIRLRLAITAPSAIARVSVVIAPPSGRGQFRLGVTFLIGLLGDMPGEREEHVIERGPP